jgi:hypothetical protein
MANPKYVVKLTPEVAEQLNILECQHGAKVAELRAENDKAVELLLRSTLSNTQLAELDALIAKGWHVNYSGQKSFEQEIARYIYACPPDDGLTFAEFEIPDDAGN